MNDETFVFRPISKFYSLTKRGILILVSTIFESSGILTPSVLEAKFIVQDLDLKGLDWDEDIPLVLKIGRKIG